MPPRLDLDFLDFLLFCNIYKYFDSRTLIIAIHYYNRGERKLHRWWNFTIDGKKPALLGITDFHYGKLDDHAPAAVREMSGGGN